VSDRHRAIIPGSRYPGKWQGPRHAGTLTRPVPHPPDDSAIRLALWDIDGTLLHATGRLAVDAYNRALRATYRLVGEVARISTAGKTDRQIALETLALHAISEDQAQALLETFGTAYAADLAKSRTELAAQLEVLPGVQDVLRRLDSLGVRQSLLTGNLEPVARMKLSCAGLEEFLLPDVGAFGSDHHDRNQLVPIALEKLRATTGEALDAEQVVVIGDTPLDIACARAGGARAVAVATGRYTPGDLAPHRPAALLATLRDTDAAVAAILNLEPKTFDLKS